HEIGHIKHRHMLYYLAFLAGSLFVLMLTLARLLSAVSGISETAPVAEEVGTLTTSLSDLLNTYPFLKAVPLVGALLAYVIFVFGFVSRRCERQADVYGCKAVSCGQPDCAGHHEALPAEPAAGLCPTGIATFIAALEKVAW